MSYAFGDSDRAAQRLALVARVFEPASREFLAAAGRRGGALAVDLGCGPGHTTELLARTLASERCVGLDASPRRTSRPRAAARRPSTGATGCEFVCHDALAAPYPTGRADTIYARFLVSHLADPEAAIGGLRPQLAPRGRMLLDEVESIESAAEPFRDYLELVRTCSRRRASACSSDRSWLRSPRASRART